MRSLFIPLRLATDARKLEFTTSLDPDIDRVRTASLTLNVCLLIHELRSRDSPHTKHKATVLQRPGNT